MRQFLRSCMLVTLAFGFTAATALAQGGMLAGKILNKETGEPISGATITLENPEANPPRLEQTTDDVGGFTMLGLNSGQWTINVEADGFEPNPGRIRIRQGRNPDIEIEMDRVLSQLELRYGAEALGDLDADALQGEIDAANAAYEGEQWGDAISGFESILAKFPVYTEAHVMIGNSYLEQEQNEEAIAAYEAAIEADPTLANVVNPQIARVRMAMGDFEGAGSILADSGGASREDLYNLGEVEFAKGEVDAAKDYYEQANQVDPNWEKPLFKLALVALNKGDIPTAKGFFEQVVEKAPDSEEGVQARATLDALP